MQDRLLQALAFGRQGSCVRFGKRLSREDITVITADNGAGEELPYSNGLPMSSHGNLAMPYTQAIFYTVAQIPRR